MQINILFSMEIKQTTFIYSRLDVFMNNQCSEKALNFP